MRLDKLKSDSLKNEEALEQYMSNGIFWEIAAIFILPEVKGEVSANTIQYCTIVYKSLTSV